MMPRLNIKKKTGMPKTHYIFIAQVLSTLLMAAGFLIFVYLWYKRQV